MLEAVSYKKEIILSNMAEGTSRVWLDSVSAKGPTGWLAMN